MWLFQGCISGIHHIEAVISRQTSDSIDFSSELANDNTLDFIAVFASTTPYPYILDRDTIVFGAELSNDSRMFPNPPKLDDIIFGAEVAGTNSLTQVVVNKDTGRDELIFGVEIAGVNTITSSLPPRNIVLSTPDTLGFSSEIAGTNTLVRVVLEHDVESDNLVFDSAINTSSVNTLTTI
jgi:hypothetical protein